MQYKMYRKIWEQRAHLAREPQFVGQPDVQYSIRNCATSAREKLVKYGEAMGLVVPHAKSTLLSPLSKLFYVKRFLTHTNGFAPIGNRRPRRSRVRPSLRVRR